MFDMIITLIELGFVLAIIAACHTAAQKKKRQMRNSMQNLQNRMMRERSNMHRQNGKLPNMINAPSQWIRQRNEAMEAADAAHAYVIGSEKYSVKDPNFSFEGRFVVDEFAQLRKKNEEHEKHLLDRLK